MEAELKKLEKITTLLHDSISTLQEERVVDLQLLPNVDSLTKCTRRTLENLVADKNYLVIEKNRLVQCCDNLLQHRASSENRLTELHGKQIGLSNRIIDLENQIKSIGERIAYLEREESKLMAEAANNRSEIDLKLHRESPQVRLLNKVTGIVWNPQTSNERLAGFVACHNTSLEAFDLSLKEHSRFFAANKLWDYIEAAVS